MNTFGWLDSEVFETFRVRHGKDNGFDDFLNLFVETANVVVIFRGLLVNLHCFNARIISLTLSVSMSAPESNALCRQSVKDQIAVLVDANQIGRLELLGLNETNQRQKDGL
jgi:hypothetical protein